MRGVRKKRCRDNKTEERKADLMFIFSLPVPYKILQYYNIFYVVMCASIRNFMFQPNMATESPCYSIPSRNKFLYEFFM